MLPADSGGRVWLLYGGQDGTSPYVARVDGDNSEGAVYSVAHWMKCRVGATNEVRRDVQQGTVFAKGLTSRFRGFHDV